MDELLGNIYLWSTLLATVMAQASKFLWNLIRKGHWEWNWLLDAGSMPSSHTAATVALATSIGLIQGFETPIFAIASVFAVIVMYDAAGVRRQSGIQSRVINEMVQHLVRIFEEIRNPSKTPFLEKLKLREIMGHQPIEILGGFCLGVVTALTLYWFLPMSPKA